MVPVRKCEQGQAKKCFEYKVPDWELVRNLKDGTIVQQRFFLKEEKQMNETLLRGVCKKLYFNPGLLSSHLRQAHHHTNTPQTNYLLKATQREAALERTGLIGLPTIPTLSGHEQLDEIWSGLGSGLELGFEQCAV